MAKKRLDILLTELAHYQSREKARAAIMAGEVFVNGQKADKPGLSVAETAEIKVNSAKPPYVSRGGFKLEEAIRAFNLDLQDKIVMDIGASTGGFTDCALQNGASKVYAIDVGYGQLAWTLRQDERVVVMERLNARYLTEEHIPEKVDVITIDASFISLNKILAPVSVFLKATGVIICLIKPQFEAGRDNVGKKGVVRDPKIHQDVILKVISDAANINLYAKNLGISPIKGPEGNIEFLCLLSFEPPILVTDENVREVVSIAHN